MRPLRSLYVISVTIQFAEGGGGQSAEGAVEVAPEAAQGGAGWRT